MQHRDEQERKPLLPAGAKPLGRRELRRQDPFRVARSAAEQKSSFLPARKKRRHAVEVRGQDDTWRLVQLCKDVEAAGGNRLLHHPVPAITKKASQPGARFRFAAGGGIDVDESSGERNWICRV